MKGWFCLSTRCICDKEWFWGEGEEQVAKCTYCCWLRWSFKSRNVFGVHILYLTTFLPINLWFCDSTNYSAFFPGSIYMNFTEFNKFFRFLSMLKVMRKAPFLLICSTEIFWMKHSKFIFSLLDTTNLNRKLKLKTSRTYTTLDDGVVLLSATLLLSSCWTGTKAAYTESIKRTHD